MPIRNVKVPNMLRGSSQLAFFLLAFASLHGCSQNPVSWWKNVNAKAEKLRKLEARYHALEEEHEALKKNFYKLENEAMDLRARVASTEESEHKLEATGSISGRTLSSIAYQVPKGLRPEEALSLAYEHFTEKRFAEAAATFEDFLKRPESAGMIDANAMYTAGVAWYQLGNYHKAREHFDEAKNNASGEQREKVHKKVDLWLRAIDRHQSKHLGGTLGG